MAAFRDIKGALEKFAEVRVATGYTACPPEQALETRRTVRPKTQWDFDHDVSLPWSRD
ncbi:hypothetical protein H8A95_08825 [Bradyrhizobium sp. Pear76]|uniref:hypothetical protein n=1 Tax=Bradyrhizobium oropedii TaxID=1571201 RepID=UPI001E5D9143|nr:hypothetical protein [Bradyrhizobium oropedii]MCC8962423.1 hypothetical protein [Bradyrhizobium oropedii]